MEGLSSGVSRFPKVTSSEEVAKLGGARSFPKGNPCPRHPSSVTWTHFSPLLGGLNTLLPSRDVCLYSCDSITDWFFYVDLPLQIVF